MEDNKLNDAKNKRLVMNEKLKSWLLYTGFAGASISAIAYLFITLVMVKGIQTDLDIQRQIVFAVIGAATGLVISFMLRSQGIAFASSEDTAKEAMESYYKALNKTKTAKQLHKISYYLLWWTIKDLFVKGVSIAISTYFVLFTFMEASNNWILLALAFSNIFMFAGFGLMSLSKAYDKYKDEHIPVIKELTAKLIAEQSLKDRLISNSDKVESGLEVKYDKIGE